MDAPAANAIPADCDKRVFAKPELTIQFRIRADAKYFRADETRTARRDHNHHAVGCNRTRKTFLDKDITTSVGKIDTNGFANTARRPEVKLRDYLAAKLGMCP